MDLFVVLVRLSPFRFLASSILLPSFAFAISLAFAGFSILVLFGLSSTSATVGLLTYRRL